MKPGNKSSNNGKARKDKGELKRNQKLASEKNAFKKLHVQLALIVALIAFGLYANTLVNGFVFDDSLVITSNRLVQQGVKSIPLLLKTSYEAGSIGGAGGVYRPLSLTLFAMLWQLFPGNPFPFHLVNVLLYAFTGFFLFSILRKLLSEYNVLIPFVTAVIFIAHPIHTEVVANIKSVDEIMSLLFVLFALHFVLVYTDKGKAGQLFFAATCYFLAMLSKENAVTMLAVIPSTLYFFRKPARKKYLPVSAALIIPAIIYLLMRKAALGGNLDTKHYNFIDNVLTAAPGISIHLATAFSILLRYIRFIIYPHPLSCDYSYAQITLCNWSSPAAIGSLILHAALVVYALMSLRKRNVVAYGILFYLITMSVYSNILTIIGSHYSDRFLYTPLLGFSIIAASLLVKLFIATKKNEHTSGFYLPSPNFLLLLKNNKEVFTVLLLLLIPYSYKTIARNTVWKSNYTLYTTDPKNAPLSARLHFYNASELMDDVAPHVTDPKEQMQLFDSAIAQYNTAIRLYPSYAFAYALRGLTYYKKGDNVSALKDYNKSLELDTLMIASYNNIGALYLDSANYTRALGFFLHAVTLNPEFFQAWRNLGHTYDELKQYDKAIEAFSTYMKYNANDALVCFSMGNIYRATGDSATAQAYYDRAYRLDPSMKK